MDAAADRRRPALREEFHLYRQMGNVRLVKDEADRSGLRTKLRRPNNGRRQGGAPFTFGHIYKLLSNPIYAGEIAHKGERYAGEHEAIVDRETWDAVQAQLEQNAVARKHGTNAKSCSLLAGLLFDADGNRMIPSHASKPGRRYRYYISNAAPGASSIRENAWRIPGSIIEETVLNAIYSLLSDRLRLGDALHIYSSRMKALSDAATRLGNEIAKAAPTEQRSFLLDVIHRVEIGRGILNLTLRKQALRNLLAGDAAYGGSDATKAQVDDELRLDVPIAFKRRGVEMKLVITDHRERPPRPDTKLIKTVAQGWEWFGQIKNGDVRSVRSLSKRLGMDQGDISRILPLGFLAPDIVEAILAGRQPIELTASRLKRRRELPTSWQEQRRLLGFA